MYHAANKYHVVWMSQRCYPLHVDRGNEKEKKRARGGMKNNGIDSAFVVYGNSVERL